jgi:hypothetical protein
MELYSWYIFIIIFELIRIHRYSDKLEICFVLISWNLSQIYKNMVDANIHGQKHLLKITSYSVQGFFGCMVIKTCLLRKEYVLLVHEAVVNLVQSWKIPKDKHLVWSFAWSLRHVC